MVLSLGEGMMFYFFRALMFSAAVLFSSSLARADIVAMDISNLAGFQFYGAGGIAGDGVVYLSPVYFFPGGTTVDFGVATLFPDPPDPRVPCNGLCFANGPSLQVFSYANGIGGPGNNLTFLDTQNPIRCPSPACNAPTSYDLIFTIGPDQDGVQFALHGDGLVIAPPVPEPSTWAMLLIGFAGIGFAYRRRLRNPNMYVDYCS
jgi:hypothetical protein